MGLADAGFDVTVFCPHGSAPAPTRLQGVNLQYVKRRRGVVGSLLYDLACLWRSRAAFDVVYMLGYASSPFCILPRLTGTRVWINMDGLEWRRSKWSPAASFWLEMCEWFACWSSSRLIFDNRAVAEDVLSRRGERIPSNVIPYGADLVPPSADDEVLEHYGLEAGEYYLAVGRFEPENQIRELIEAHCASGVQRPLVLVTNDVDSAYARDTRALAGDRIRFLGSVYEPERLVSLREQCRAYLHGHSVGGTNPSLLESMACGKPVLAHRNPFNWEVLGAAGRWFGDVPELVQQLEVVDGLDEGALQQEGEAARDRVSENYTWEQVISTYVELLGGTVQATSQVQGRRAG